MIDEPPAPSEGSNSSRCPSFRMTACSDGALLQPEFAGSPAFSRIRMASANNSRASTPDRGLARGGGLVGSGFPGGAPFAPRGMQDNLVLAEMRRHIENFEDKVCGQLDKIHARNEKQRSIEVSRLEGKISLAEGSLPKIERRMAELTGNSRGLSDELQAQIRRVDGFEERFWEWRHQMEQNFSRKQGELEQKLTKMSSEARVAVAAIAEKQEKQAQKLHKYEMSRQELQASHEDARQGLLHLHERLSTVESQSVETSSATSRGLDLHGMQSLELEQSPLPHMFERQLEDVDSKVLKTNSAIHDLHSQIATQGEVLKSLKTRFDAKEDNWRFISERLERLNLESKLESIHQTLAEEAKQRIETTEQLAVMVKSLKDQEEAFNELCESHAVLQLSESPKAVQASHADAEVSNHAVMLQHLEDRVSAVETGMRSVHEVSQIGSRVDELVTHLQDVVPQVVTHEGKIQQLGDQHLQDILPRLAEQESKIQRLGDQHSTLAEKVGKHIAQRPLPPSDNNTSNKTAVLDRADGTCGTQRYDEVIQRIDDVSYNLSVLDGRVHRSEQHTVELKHVIQQCQEKMGSLHANMNELSDLSSASKVPNNPEALHKVASDLQNLVDKVHDHNQSWHSHKDVDSQIKVKIGEMNNTIGRIASIQASLPTTSNGESIQREDP